jgi:UDPglucose 6-dehydrogenase
MKSVAVIGQGFVGGTLATVLSERGCNVFAYDKTGKYASGVEDREIKSIGELAMWTEKRSERSDDPFVRKDFSGIYFVCVPTPMRQDGSSDTSIVDGVLKSLVLAGVQGVAVVKSTVPPGSTEKWNRNLEGTGLHVVFNPEFLTEANALDDMRNQSRIILGGPRPWINQVRLFYRSAFPTVPIVKTSSTMAEMVKYFTNVHLAARVVLSCELWQVCEALDRQGLNIDYDKVVEYAGLDHRLGGSHMHVPGNDGVAGARGHCFPKDLNALIAVARSVGVDPKVMSAVWAKNLEVIPPDDRDWERMIGRAVSEAA